MTTGGVTPQGFIQPTEDEIDTSLGQGFLNSVSPTLDLAPDQPFGQIASVIASMLAPLWELGGTVYNALDPDNAEGPLLTNAAALSGTRPQVATYSKLNGVLLTLNAGTTVLAGSIIAVSGQPANQWVLLADVVAALAGPPAQYAGNFRSSQVGPFAANATTATSIVTPVAGWTVVTNPTDAVQGLLADTDTSLRLKREQELRGEGGGDNDAIRAALLKVSGVLQAFVFENTSIFTDTNGLPGKAFRAVVWDGVGLSAANATVAQAIWNEKASGIQAFGAQSGTAVDGAGNSQTVPFDRATQLPVYISLTTAPTALTAPQIAAIKAQLVAYALTTWQLGQSVIALTARAAAILPGVTTDIPLFQLGFAPSPTGIINLPVSGLQIATLATGNILVNGL